MRESNDNNPNEPNNSQPDGQGRGGADPDSKVEKLIKTAAQNLPTPEPGFFERLEEGTTEMFLQSHLDANSSGVADATTLPTSASPAVKAKPQTKPQTGVNRFWIVAAGAMAACAAGVMIWLGVLNNVDDDLSLGAALNRTAGTKSLKMNLTLVSETHEIRAAGGKVRLDLPDATYEIAVPETTWLVDEAKSQVKTASGKYFDVLGNLSLLSFLHYIPESEYEPIRNLQPDAGEPVSFEGTLCRRYRSEINCDDYGRCGIEAFVEIETGMLRLIEIVDTKLADPTGQKIARLNMVAWDQPLDEDLFVISEKLTPAGQIARIATVQGYVSFRPVMHTRWSRVQQNLALEIGDQIRTNPRGASGVEFRLADRSRVTVGPHSLVELVSKNNLRLVRGDLRIIQKGEGPLTVSGPDDQKMDHDETAAYRVVVKDGQQALTRLDDDPSWLAGFEGTSQHDPTGSLVATIDGRNVPLTVGYHKVNVEIRDQIARTVIEKSFVNHTDAQLEGVFYFPLPQDASISGFGMWINGQLIEADVVEKQRAREIYETILRERRDPGLLEWTGGNIFKARVFPILAESEKRIKITYTQVLPRRGNRYVYHYGLQSELLSQHPLRELAIDVKVNSATPLSKINCPTHSTRDSLTGNSAHVEFSATEFTPKKDFEVTVDVADDAPNVVVVPHRRGDDGYFLMQVSPPSTGAVTIADTRQMLASGDPLKLLIVADTSASMNKNARQQQADFVADLVSMLSPTDKVNLVAADVQPQWQPVEGQQPDWQPGGEAAAAGMHRWLSERDSLGWTDLEKTFETISKRVGAQTHVIYVGDAMVSTYSSDLTEFSAKLKRMFADLDRVTVHAVSTGSSFESRGLKAMAAIGGGSWRKVSGSRTPDQVAAELLHEIAAPALRDMKVEFDGVRVARLYPETLPNLRNGQQQILLGRYLPTGDDQAGTARITAMSGDEEVSWSVPIKLADAESGNSFVPRLWARMHLDYLLEQGSSEFIQDQIIGLSEEFHIITPYTSLLVLESDADRERFGVKRRFNMRDGEQFFADGRDNANFELMQKQMQAAGNWRLGIQRQLLNQFATLGRPAMQSRNQYGGGAFGGAYLSGGEVNLSGVALDGFVTMYNGQARSSNSSSGSHIVGGSAYSGPVAVDYLGRTNWGVDFGTQGFFERDESRPQSYFVSASDLQSSLSTYNYEPAFRVFISDGDSLDLGRLSNRAISSDRFLGRGPVSRLRTRTETRTRSVPVTRTRTETRTRNVNGRIETYQVAVPYTENVTQSYTVNVPYVDAYSSEIISSGRKHFPAPAHPTYAVFPSLPSNHQATSAVELPDDWSEEIRDLLQPILHSTKFEGLDQGIEVQSSVTGFDTRFGHENSATQQLTLYRAGRWLTRTDPDKDQTRTDWCVDDRRNAAWKAFGTATRRPATPSDRRQNPLMNDAASLDMALRARTTWKADIEPVEGEANQTRLMLKSWLGDSVELVLNTERQVVVSVVNKNPQGNVTSSMKMSDFVQVGELWWPGKTESRDADGYLLSQTVTKVRLLDEVKFNTAVAKQVPDEKETLYLDIDPLRDLRSATAAIADGKGTLADHLLRFHQFQSQLRWDKARFHFDAIEKLAGGRAAVDWLKIEFLFYSRRNEELRLAMIEQASRLVENDGDNDKVSNNEYFLANHLTGRYYILAAEERLAILDQLGPVFKNDDTAVGTTRNISWRQYRAALLDQLGLRNDATGIWEELAANQRHLQNPQSNWLRRLFADGERELAFQMLDRIIEQGPNPEKKPFENPAASRWLDHEFQQLINLKMQQLKQDGSYRELLETCQQLIEQQAERAVDRTVYSNYLEALLQTDQLDKAEQEVADWLKEIKDIKPRDPAAKTTASPSPLESSLRNRVHTAIAYALGDQIGRARTFQPKWESPLTELVREASERAETREFASTVLNHNQFRNRDSRRRIRKTFSAKLDEQFEQLSPAEALWYASHGQVETDRWKKLYDRSLTRWRAATDVLKQANENFEVDKNPDTYAKLDEATRDESSLHQLTLQFSFQVSQKVRGEYLRERIERSARATRVAASVAFYQYLQSRGWTQANEDEMWKLIPGMIAEFDAEKPAARKQQLDLMLQWVDSMVNLRQTKARTEIKNPDNKLSPKELAQKQSDAARQAVIEFSDALAKRAAAADTDDWLKAWLRTERSVLDVRLSRNLPEVISHCKTVLGQRPGWSVVADADADLAANGGMENLLRERALKTLLFLGAQKTASKEDRQWIADHIQQGLNLTSDDITVHAAAELPEKNNEADPRDAEFYAAQRKDLTALALKQRTENWKLVKYQWMIMTDQTDELIEQLQAWVESDQAEATWRHALAVLLAERGEVKPAIEHFERIERENELTAGDYRLLSGWYMADDRRADFERARRAVYDATPENQLYNFLQQQISRIAGRTDQTPDELDEDVRFAITSLMSRTQNPENYRWQIQQLYQATRDFRILAGVADGLIGQSAQGIYRQLSMWKNLTSEIRHEATADSLLKGISELRQQAKTDSDLRALDLLESLIERRSSEVENQPGPHIQRAVDAMRLAFERDWQSGERVLMAGWLQGLGQIAQLKVKEVQLEQLSALLAAERDSDSRWRIEHSLQIAHSRAQTMWRYHREQAVADELQFAVGDYIKQKAAGDQKSGLRLSSQAISANGTLIRYQKYLRQFSAGEKWLKQLMDVVVPSQQPGLISHLDSLYIAALDKNGQVSLGNGEELYKNLHARFFKQLEESKSDGKIAQSVGHIVSLFYTACNRKPYSATAKSDLNDFAFGKFPSVLRGVNNSYTNLTQSVASLLKSQIDVGTGIRFYVERIENQPVRVQVHQQLRADYLASWIFPDGKSPIVLAGPLEKRLVAIIVKELKHVMQTTQWRSYNFVGRDHYFWERHLDEFERAAEQVWQEHRSSGSHVSFIADYLYQDLKKHSRAIELLKQADEADLLNKSNRFKLVKYLHEQDRYAESIDLLQALLKQNSNKHNYHTRLMEAYFRTKQPAKLQAALKFADEKIGTLNQESALRALAKKCNDVQLYDAAAKYFSKLVEQRKGNSNDSLLSQDYIGLSVAHSVLGNLESALDAANAAVVVWGGRSEHRGEALANLTKVVNAIRSGKLGNGLDGLVEYCDEKAAKSGQYNYLLRKAIGNAYKDSQQYPLAIKQLQLAVELQPGDREIHESLIACYDLADDKDGAARQLFELIKLYPREVSLYTQLGDRLAEQSLAVQYPGGKERALTSMIEMLPTETEGHAQLAKIRQQQNRWDDAIVHWQRVAELRSKEPDGLLNLCRAYLHQRQRSEVQSALKQLRRTVWPARFDKTLESELPKLQSELGEMPGN